MTIEPVRHGPTYKLLTHEENVLYVTVNGKVRTIDEIFIRQDKPELHELTTVIARFVSVMIREGLPLSLIIAELEAIHSPFTAHFIPGIDKICPSLTARVGHTMKRFIEENPNA